MPEASRSHRLAAAAEIALLAAAALVPLLLTKQGMLAADTKQYLYLDPGRLLSSALSMWDPSVAAGTVTHQNIGYLFPQGPFYYLLEAVLRVPPWVAQRLWMAALLFGAGTGMRYLARLVRIERSGVVVAALAYELSPYAMQYVERISAILMPFAALGWLLGFTIVALRRGGWRHPALFAIVAAAAGGTNASSIVFVGIAPVCWILYAAFLSREVTGRRALAATCRIAILTLGTALWWAAGLRTEGAYGINVLIYTETLPAIASSSAPIEVLRGLGYWYFYGSDRLGSWLEAAVYYEEKIALLVTSYALPALGVLGAALVRWRERAYFVAVTLIGLVLSVGTHPFGNPSIAGLALKEFMSKTTVGLALRSSDRATPLVVMGLTVLLGAGVAALQRRLKTVGALAALVALALVAVNAYPLFAGDAVAQNFERASKLPSYDHAAARYLDSKPSSTRVLIEPGQDFGDYTYGDTVDPIWPGIMTRPTIQRQQLIDGSYATADLLGAFDLAIQQGTYEPSTLAPIARLLSAGDMLWQSDLAFWRYDNPPPKAAWQAVDVPTKGVGKPIGFGGRRPNVAPAGDRLIDEQELSLPAGQPWPPRLAVFPISHARPIERTEPATSPLLLDGSGEGVVDAAATGLLDDNPTLIYAGTLDTDKAARREAIVPGATLVVTDSDRKELERFESENDNIGETLPAVKEPSSYDPTQVPLQIFGHQPSSAESVAQYSGAVYVTASSYGNSVAETPEDRPYMAFDNSSSTAWTTSAFARATGQWLQVKLAAPVTAERVRLSQVLGSGQDRFIKRVTLSFDGGKPLTRTLGASSRTAKGQVVRFPSRRFRTLRIRIDSTTAYGHHFTGASGVGFSSVSVPGVHLFEWIRLPKDLLSLAGSSSLSHRLVILLTRQRVAPYPPRTDPEPFLARTFSLGTARTFSLGGTARISPLIADNVIDELLAGPNAFDGTVVGSNERLPGDLDARAAFAFDGNPKTHWSPGFESAPQLKAWVQASVASPISFDHMKLQLVADGRHSVPTEMRISSDDGTSELVSIPPVKDRSKPNSVVTVKLHFPAISGNTFRFSIVKIRKVTTIDWYSQKPITEPVGIAEMGVPGIHVTPENPKSRIPAVCRDDLLRIDGKKVYLEVSGTVGAAEKLDGLSIKGCGPDAHGIRLGRGTHRLVATNGQLSGFNIDQLSLDSAAGGGAEQPLRDSTLPPVKGTLAGGGDKAVASPKAIVLSSGADSSSLRLTGVTKGRPFWLVLGESVNKGWTATLDGRSLGAPTLIDGYANGWYVDPARSGSILVRMDFAPQHLVSMALIVSAVFLWICLVLAVLPERVGSRVARRLRRRPAAHAASRPAVATSAPPAASSPLLDISGAGERRPGIVSLVLAVVLTAAVAYAVLPRSLDVPAAAAFAALAAASSLVPHVRRLLGVAGFALVAAAGGWVIHHQLVTHAVAGSTWPTELGPAGVLAGLGVVALFADAVAETTRRRSPRRRGTAVHPESETGSLGAGPERQS